MKDFVSKINYMRNEMTYKTKDYEFTEIKIISNTFDFMDFIDKIYALI